jgi:sugar phosphate isomerase/epimerase
MKIGLSTYSLSKAIHDGEMDVCGAIEWIAENGGKHVEIVPSGFEVTDEEDTAERIRAKAESVGLEISSYTVGANFVQESEEEYEAEVQRMMREVDVGHRLGVSLMRHDAASRPPEEATIENFEKDLPKVAEACRRVADHASRYGITTSVENHGYHVQHSDRVRRLIQAVDRPNYKTTIDVGNFMCVDENAVAAVKKNVSLASMIHLKDFYFRPGHEDPGEGWFRTAGGNYLRGAIVGQGDLDMRRILKAVKDGGYDGYLSIEFEGMEECRLGSRIGMENTRRLWGEL